ncbi:hypothetical protein [Armatimonas rosea]|uniref:SHOCT domain-containing protein n=1 Tax=Armatimonas rosea TaxID=685828 RepID=A0A7W9SSE2_ARMRO|nr:hypothetical protein [Armatimonas rosea]MBB6051846.1 hypothetical protein [Armatimonas rosea]
MSQGFSDDALAHAKAALEHGNGKMAQFSHPELGGSGQWMPGMVMIGDAFNQPLKARVLALFTELASQLQAPPAPVSTPITWWPAALGMPSQAGGQNALAYAHFPNAHCLAVRREKTVTLYDTRGHSVTGISAQNDQLTVQTAAGLSFLAEMLPKREA